MATVILTVGLAFIGYLATYLNGLRLTQRQARLTRVNVQLSDFYGPPFALLEANSRAYDTLSPFQPGCGVGVLVGMGYTER
ncbi:hypothetical protein AB0D78_06545 [Streptomyces avermitilis]|uniref:hypothetical protein n=1 Tax=Streptomyces avermitilis TaxID=33903 RepID=UPI0034118EA7